MGTAALEGLAGGPGRKQAGEAERKEREAGPLDLNEAGDSLMKADTGRILRQRFCFLMAIVSCREGGE